MAEPQDNKDKNAVRETVESFEELTRPIKKAADAMTMLVKESEKLNQNFGLARSRIIEMQRAIADSAMGVISLGGKLSDATVIIEKVAEGSRRNVIANKETVAELYAANKVLGLDAQLLVEKFGSVGYEASQIGTNLEDSIKTVQGLGLDARVIMKDVATNMEQMNRFQFQDGVQGLTRMAAQASMLRFNMNETFKLADRVLTPEGAINTAAAFQRLGVTVGNLVDPFALMNQSIMDPSGLQNSLKEVAKSFTYFDEETKSFKINPQGVLTLKELEEQTHVSATEMSKMGLAAAELDRRLSDVSAAGLKFENEDDKQYLANIAKMGKGGKYEVELKDGTKKELQKLNQEEFDELIDQQRKQPKTLEEIATKQMNFAEVTAYSAKAILDAITYGAVSTRQGLTNTEGATDISRNISSTYTQVKNKDLTEETRSGVSDLITQMSKLFSEKESGKIGSTQFQKSVDELEKKLEEKTSTLGSTQLKKLKESINEGLEKSQSGSMIEKKLQEIFGVKSQNTTLSDLMQNQTNSPSAAGATTRSLLTPQTTRTQMAGTPVQTRQFNSKIDMSGTIEVKLVGPPAGVLGNITEQQFRTYLESEDFKKKIYEYYNEKAKELQKS